MNCRQLLICCGAASLLLFLCTARALPQDMTVYTTIARVGQEEPNETVGRSLTLFHAGKVYDFMEDAGELVVLDQQADTIIILNGNYTATRVELDELNQFLAVAHSETNLYIAELAQQSDVSARQTQAWLQFQLQPQFHEETSAASLIKLSSPLMRYEVATSPAPDPQRVQQYLSYADCAARLNFVLHPGSTFPAPRLTLNQTLRQQEVLPVSVTLTNKSAAPITLRAEHKYQWELQQAEKAHIHKWERLLESTQLRWVSFQEYQQRLLADAQRGK
jgi:hypothetical protein